MVGEFWRSGSWVFNFEQFLGKTTKVMNGWRVALCGDCSFSDIPVRRDGENRSRGRNSSTKVRPHLGVVIGLEGIHWAAMAKEHCGNGQLDLTFICLQFSRLVVASTNTPRQWVLHLKETSRQMHNTRSTLAGRAGVVDHLALLENFSRS